MAKKSEKILTSTQVKELGLDKVAVITEDMLEGYTSIEEYAFAYSGLTSVTIPNSVTSIGDYAFQGCSSLTSIEIPNSVTSIGNRVFQSCSGLTSINVATDNSNYCSVDGVLFNKDKTTLIQYPVGKQGEYSIPNSVTRIGDGAFYNCSGLTSVTIPNSVTSIGGIAFYRCSGLTSVSIPNSVTSIGDWAFYGCTGLTSVSIPNSVTSIGYGAFTWCTRLTSVTIGDKTYEKQTITNGKCKAYKGFNVNMTCRDFQYEEGKTYEFEGKPKLCEQGFHASLSLSDVFNYYYGKIGEDVVIHEVELENVSDERNECDSKVVAKKITIGKRIL